MRELTKIQSYLLSKNSKTYESYYNGKMSYRLHGREWESYISQNFPDVFSQTTSENIFKTVIDLYVDSIIPQQKEFSGIVNSLIPLLCRGEAPVIITSNDSVVYPEHYEIVSDGDFVTALIFSRSLREGKDYLTFIDSDGITSLWEKKIPDDYGIPSHDGYRFVEETSGNVLIRLSMDDKGFGSSLASLQDRINHSIIDQTIIAEMYARPFWYLLNTDLPVQNPYIRQPSQDSSNLREVRKDGSGGRVFVTSSEGPFGQLTPPTIGDMIAYHESIMNKVTYVTGIPQFYFIPGEGTPPTGAALRVMSNRFNNKISRIRDNIYPCLEVIADHLGIEKTHLDTYDFWKSSDDILQDAIDAHGIALSQMGYPLEYTASIVTPGVDLADYMDDGLAEDARQGLIS